MVEAMTRVIGGGGGLDVCLNMASSSLVACPVAKNSSFSSALVSNQIGAKCWALPFLSGLAL